MIKELHEKLKNKEITSSELTGKYLDRIKKNNERLNVFLDVYEEEAMQKAQAVDKKISKGGNLDMLEGIPCALKDNLCVMGKRTTAASKILENYIAPYSATVVDKILEKGSIIVGKTNLDEFAFGASTENSAFGPTKNPHDEERVPGGSSGGSGAAVADEMAVWALGSDTGGSIRLPANFCGIVGMKPTYGRVSRYGLMAMASSYDQIGPMAQTVEDAAIVLDAIVGQDKKDNTTIDRGHSFQTELNSQAQGKKIGIIKQFMDGGLDKRINDDIKDQLEKLKNSGAEIVELDFPNIKHSLAVYYLMVPSEISSNLARFDGIKYGLSEANLPNSRSKNILDVYNLSRELGFGSEVKRRIILGTYALSAGYFDAYYKKAQKVREVIKKDFLNIFKEVDAVLAPVSPSLPFKIGEKTDDPLSMYLVDIFTVSANVAMLPAIAVPTIKIEEDGRRLPLGVQLIGKWWDEQGILNIAKKIEEKNNFLKG
jgi:aspartyl-tRNA(Asn)/glutamyl-tRNA(Gln) amidotransferase subunit A